MVISFILFGSSDLTYAAEVLWQKHKTTHVNLNSAQQLISPGLYDLELQTTVKIHEDGQSYPINLPHAGKDEQGKDRKPLQAIFKNGHLWLDVNENGRQDAGEVHGVKAGESAGPFVYQASYDDGTTGPYVFSLGYTGSNGCFRIFRGCARKVTVGKDQIILLDDNGNGLFNDIGRDAIIVNHRPVTFLGRQIFLGDQLNEILVHPSGQVFETRAIQNVPMGTVNLFLLYKAPQKSENLKIHTLIISGRNGSFSFDDTRTEQKVPIGAYDLVFGLFERSKEWILLKSGERTSFTVEVDKVASPPWGGPISGTIQTESDGKNITIHPPVFKGVGSEIYRPVDWTIPLRAFKLLVWRDRALNNVERYEQQAAKRFVVSPGGEPLSLSFEHFRNDELQMKVSYASGILGTVVAEARVSFVHKRN